MEGGAAVVLCDSQSGRGGSWGEDGNIIASLGNGLLSRIPSAGGAPTPVTELAQGGEIQRWPQILPGGKAVLFTSSATANAWDGASIEVVSLADRRRKTLQQGGTYGRYVPSSNGRDGHLIYVNRGTLFAVPFDLEALAVRGTPSPVLEQVSYSSAYGYAQFDFSQKGTLVYRSGSAEGSLLTVQWLDSAGKMQPLLAKPDAYQSARLSPDGQRLAISTTDLWVYEWQRDTMTRLTFGGSLGGNSVPAVWSPDGRYLIFRKPGKACSGRAQMGRASRNSWFKVRLPSGRIPSRLTGNGSPFEKAALGRGTTYGPCLWRVTAQDCGAGSLRCFLQRSSTSSTLPSLPMGVGWPIRRMRGERIRYLCGRFPTEAASGKSPTAEARTRSGHGTEGSYSSVPLTTILGWRRTP